MRNKDNAICLENDKFFEQRNVEIINPYCRERSPMEYYMYRQQLNGKKQKCICTNQELISNDFCEICNTFF